MDASEIVRCFQADMRPSFVALGGLDAGEEGCRLGLIGQDGHDGGGVDGCVSASRMRCVVLTRRWCGRSIGLRRPVDA